MEKTTYKDLDNRIHAFLNRKFAELETLERMAHTSEKKSWRLKPQATKNAAEWWVGA
ncbi:MAG TPA: hypothetical protein VLF62_03795 [Candidatus Saccharimonadales bacterium]|jgi:hypothetical protein|nr:hypothetical protein [Candidatus Saccharimonadales bacterium]